MTIQYIRETYGVPATVGRQVEFVDGNPRRGIIVGAAGSHLRVRMDGEKLTRRFHPTWRLRYLSKDGQVIYPKPEAPKC